MDTYKKNEVGMMYDLETLQAMAKSKRVHLIGEISEEMLLRLSTVSPLMEPDTELWITSPGGNLDICLALIDIINLNKNITKIVANGEVASAGAIIFVASNKERYMTENASLMFHQASIESNARLISEYAEKIMLLEAANQNIRARITQYFPTKKTAEMKRFLRAFDAGKDVVLTAEVCYDWKLIKAILK